MKLLRYASSDSATETLIETFDDCISSSPLDARIKTGLPRNPLVGPSLLSVVFGAGQRTPDSGESGAASALF